MMKGLIALLTACLLTCPSSTLATPTSTAPVSYFTQAVQGGEFLYTSLRIDDRNLTRRSPNDYRSRGGLSVDANPFAEQAWDYSTSWQRTRWVRLGRHVEQVVQGEFGDMYARWVYQVAASPHMVPHVGWARAFTHAAVDGIPWSAVRQWALSEGDWQSRSTNLEWFPNPDYDARWEMFGPNSPQPLLSRMFPVRGQTARWIARAFINDLTSRQNTALSPSQLETLRELLDWNPDQEPDRDFPLVRTRQPVPLTTAVLQQYDWSRHSVPPQMQLMLVGAILPLAECIQVMHMLADLQTPHKSRVERRVEATIERRVERGDSTTIEPGDSCQQLAQYVQTHPDHGKY
ncbi:hypothetical protein CDD81_145 [Ophiocordyceps australis]|uniref:Enterotoxin n=1 Tax=Ophiocordyceps australis TaxID=1399860 RepID=A0A2C5YI38_9HYPO|nr:hypothetical protein CDD81_145 [Ophiocordyceps australis]